MLGYPEEELLGKTLREFVYPDDLDWVLNELMYAIDNKIDSVTLTFRQRHRQGQYLWFESRTNVIRSPEISRNCSAY